MKNSLPLSMNGLKYIVNGNDFRPVFRQPRLSGQTIIAFDSTYKNKFNLVHTDQTNHDNGTLITQDAIFGVNDLNVNQSPDDFMFLVEQGHFGNLTPLNKILQIRIDISNGNLPGAKLYFGSYCGDMKNGVDIDSRTFTLNFSESQDVSYFFIKVDTPLVIRNLEITYLCDSELQQPHRIPVIDIQTEGGMPESKTEYKVCNFNFTNFDDATQNIVNAPGQIRVRGNFTSTLPKKPYRLKFNSKQSLFGLTKAKNWVLLADYQDGGLFRQIEGQEFLKLVRDSSEFVPTLNKVAVTINNNFLGTYTLLEQPDEKTGRMNMEQEPGFYPSLFNEQLEFDLNDFPFMIDRDDAIATEEPEMQDVTWFGVQQSDGTNYVYEIKYPEPEDFEESGEIRWDKWNAFLARLKTYVKFVGDTFIDLHNHVSGAFDTLNETIDLDSFTSQALTDLFFREFDHEKRSIKLYHRANEKLRFGPCWDYESYFMNLPPGESVLRNPLYYWDDASAEEFKCGDAWAQYWVDDTDNGFIYLKNLWNSKMRGTGIETYRTNLRNKLKASSYDIFRNIDIWANYDYSRAYDSFIYANKWIEWRTAWINDQFTEETKNNEQD